MHFLEWKCSYFYSNFTEILRSNYEQASIVSGNGLAPNRRRAITWSNGGPFHWRINASGDLNAFINMHIVSDNVLAICRVFTITASIITVKPVTSHISVYVQSRAANNRTFSDACWWFRILRNINHQQASANANKLSTIFYNTYCFTILWLFDNVWCFFVTWRLNASANCY